jgi:hypothetical protein
MKKILFRLSAALLLLMAVATTAYAQNGNGNDNQLIGRAIGAFNGGCAGPAIGPLNGSVETTGICFVSGFLQRVILFRQVNCQQVDCNAIRLAPVGYVDFDCEGNITNVSCVWP